MSEILDRRGVQGIDWDGQAVIDATNDWAADDLIGRTSSELVRLHWSADIA